MSQTAAKQLERMEGYVSGLRSVQRIISDAKREEKVWCKARCNAILADCRKRFYCVCGPPARTLTFPHGKSVSAVWWTCSGPPSHRRRANRTLIWSAGCTRQKGWPICSIGLLSSAIIVESEYPVKDEETTS